MREIKVFLCFDTTDEQEKALAFRHNFDEHVTNFAGAGYRILHTSNQTSYDDPKHRHNVIKGILYSDVFLILLGPKTVRRESVKTELEIAQALGKPIIQLRSHGKKKPPFFKHLDKPITCTFRILRENIKEVIIDRDREWNQAQKAARLKAREERESQDQAPAKAAKAKTAKTKTAKAKPKPDQQTRSSTQATLAKPK